MWWDELNDADYAPARRSYAPKDGPPKLHYNSITSRRPILNAITGEHYYAIQNNKKVPYRMGSRDELRFYAVVQGEPGNPKESCKLFFDSPEQYERFSGIEVSAQSKAAYMDRKKELGMVNQYELRELEELGGVYAKRGYDIYES